MSFFESTYSVSAMYVILKSSVTLNCLSSYNDLLTLIKFEGYAYHHPHTLLVERIGQWKVKFREDSISRVVQIYF